MAKDGATVKRSDLEGDGKLTKGAQRKKPGMPGTRVTPKAPSAGLSKSKYICAALAHPLNRRPAGGFCPFWGRPGTVIRNFWLSFAR